MAVLAYRQLAGLPALRRFYRLVWRLFGVNVALGDPKGLGGFQMGSARRAAPFCAELQRSERFRDRCLECDRRHLEALRERRQAFRYRCHAGLTEFLIPITLDGELVAFLQSGQILDAPPAGGGWQRMRSALRLTAAEAERLEPLYRRIRSVPPGAQLNLIALLDLFGNYIAYAQSRLLLLKQGWDSQVVARAKDHIRGHLAGPVSLDHVAGAAFTSKRNLTRVFSRETGETVLGFIHRSRIEEACRRLLAGEDNCLRISGRCGFGSVQQFNRVFRKLKGTTPLVWKRRRAEEGV